MAELNRATRNKNRVTHWPVAAGLCPLRSYSVPFSVAQRSAWMGRSVLPPLRTSSSNTRFRMVIFGGEIDCRGSDRLAATSYIRIFLVFIIARKKVTDF